MNHYNFVNQMVQNIDYNNKPLVMDNLHKFLQNFQSFRPWETVRQNGQNFFCFIQLRGLIQIGQNLHEMLIGIPRNYPQVAPVFLLALNRQIHYVNNEQYLTSVRQIMFQKNQKGEDYVKFIYPFLLKDWNPKSTLTDTYKLLKAKINNPPLLVQINQPREAQKKNTLTINSNNKIHSEKLKQIIQLKMVEVSQVGSSISLIGQQKQKINYSLNRADCLQKHLTELQQALSKKIKHYDNSKQRLKVNYNDSQKKKNCDAFLQVNVRDQQMINKMSEQAALVLAQKKLKEKLTADLSNGSKYSDYKKLIKVMFDKMFQNQSNILKLQE